MMCEGILVVVTPRCVPLFFAPQAINKGHGVETIHSLNDGLWKDYRLEINV